MNQTMSASSMAKKATLWSPVVIIAALGYFVDMYDLIVFSVVRVPSLKALGLADQELFKQGLFLLNMQMIGIVIGGVLWGILGDKKGRLSVLFGSIFIYSIANLGNAYINSIPGYALMRLISGIGLAGEFGAGVTLVSEVLPTHLRGQGTTLVTIVGVLGAISAAATGGYFDWRTTYIVGGLMGLVLLVMRISVSESEIFKSTKTSSTDRGNFISLFTSWDRAKRYLSCIAIGVPIWFVLGVLITFAPEFAKAFELTGPISPANPMFYAFCGVAFGGFACGALSQVLKSRKIGVGVFLILLFVTEFVYLRMSHVTPDYLYWVCSALGFTVGYWGMFATIAAEQFGTNLRATVATSTPTFVRGTTVPISLVFASIKGTMGPINAAILLAVATSGMAILILWKMQETFHRDMNFVEKT